MPTQAGDRPTPVLPFTRGVFVAGVCLTAGTGVGLFAMPDRTADYWAWEIAAPPSAAFFGAGYVGAALALAFAAGAREWRRARVVAVLALTLTSLSLVATLLEPEPFAFGAGGLPEAVAWIWLGVYVGLPPLVLAAFVLQERRGGAQEYTPELPALPATLLALGGAGALLGVLGVGLFVGWGWLAARYPWPLPPLPARIVGAWLCTYAAGLMWFALRERDWRRVRIAVLPAAIAVALDLVAAARLRESLDGGVATAMYLAALGAMLVTIAAAALAEEGRLRRAGST